MITQTTAIVYYAPTKGRRYFSKSAAIHAEARAIIKKHYPDEKGCSGICVGCEYPGCGDLGWSLEEAQPDRYARYYRMLASALGRMMV